MNIWTFTLFSLSTILLSASVLEIFPKQCSQYFYDNLKSKEVLLPEAVLREENHGTFSISLWMKLIDITKSGTIFTMKIAE
ncbi:unnamed protein product [Blepharisma stoltei]|uniref:Uncharacterized protein n=1 Tax=Blepharisma stoltei TaxID=1481888 RepID=A0AAU9JM80_9CILI|nr:unnamed protein product [Blepharisma stoltei]